jgi:D-alanine-D-alanine ligase
MPQHTKRRVIVLYGGKSTEHEVSCRSAATILNNLNADKYEISAIGVDKDGNWLQQDAARLRASSASTLPIESRGTLTLSDAGKGAADQILAVTSPALLQKGSSQQNSELIVFPIIHGTNGEDGTLQGLFELANVAFVGPDTLGSAVGMDKGVAKKLAMVAGVPVAPFIELRAEAWAKTRPQVEKLVLETMKYPVFVKPAKLGSSVGISKVKGTTELVSACENAFSFDDKILIEQGLDVREIECAALGGYDPKISIPGEVIPHAEFYSYEAKYLDEAASSVEVPAKLSPEQVKTAQDMSRDIFRALDLYGMARIDLFLEKSTGKFYFNEVNTVPGFTNISQYPMLWKASGVPISDLLDQLIELAVQRKQDKAKLKRSRV